MNEIQIFNNAEFGQVRTITEDGKTLFCAKDVAAALGYKDTTNAIKQHCKGVVKRHLLTKGGQQGMNFIPEGDIYRLVVRSDLPGADKFESWIFDDVMPTIRETGTYTLSNQALPEASADGVADLIRITRRVLLESGGTAQDVRQMTKELYQTYRVQVPTPLQESAQMNLFNTDYQLTLTE